MMELLRDPAITVMLGVIFGVWAGILMTLGIKVMRALYGKE